MDVRHSPDLPIGSRMRAVVRWLSECIQMTVFLLTLTKSWAMTSAGGDRMIVNMCTRSAGGIGWYPPSFDNRPRTLILGEKTIMRTGLDDSDQWTLGKDLSPLRFVRDDPVPHGDLHPPVDPDVVVDDAICLLLCNGGEHATTWSKRGGITERVRVVSVASSRVLLVRRSSEHLITGQQHLPFRVQPKTSIQLEFVCPFRSRSTRESKSRSTVLSRKGCIKEGVGERRKRHVSRLYGAKGKRVAREPALLATVLSSICWWPPFSQIWQSTSNAVGDRFEQHLS